jgi:hypothetical protein
VPLFLWLAARTRTSYHHHDAVLMLLSGATAWLVMLAWALALVWLVRTEPPHTRYTVGTTTLKERFAAAVVIGTFYSIVMLAFVPGALPLSEDPVEQRLENIGTAAFAILAWLVWVSRSVFPGYVLNRWRRRHPQDPLDELALAMLALASLVERSAHDRRWADSRSAAAVVRNLQACARTAERVFVRRAPWGDPSARRAARTAGLQLAAVLRSHKAPVLTALGPRDYTRTAASLSAGLVAWSQQDLPALLANAPEVTLRDRIRPYARRWWPPLVTLGFAFALPRIPSVHAHPAFATNLRDQLLVIAALAVLGGGAVSDRIAAVAAKALPVDKA